MSDTTVTMFAVLFTTPLSTLLFVGLAAAVPILIHLLNRKRYVVVPWAAMRFLIHAQKKNVRKLKLEQWLLLATRILVGLFLIAAMASVMNWAEPFWQRFFPGGMGTKLSQGRTHRIFVIDASFSMATRQGEDSTRFELAKEQAYALLDRSSPGDGFSLVFLSNPAQTIIPGPVDDPSKVKAEIDQLKLPHGSADVQGGIHAIGELLAKPLGKYTQREVYFLTDLKRSSWVLPQTTSFPMGENASSLTEDWQRLGSAARVVFIDVAKQDLPNLAVTSLALNEPLPLVGVNLGLSAVIQNFGNQERRKVRIELSVGEGKQEPFRFRPIEQKWIDIKPNSSITVPFMLENQNRLREPGEYLFQVRLDADFLPLDDSRTLAVQVRDTIPVLLVNGKNSSEPLERASEWLKRALYPFPESMRVPGYPARPTVLNLAQFADAALGDLTKYDCVFLCDVPRLNGNEVKRLETHLRRGGSLIIGMGPESTKNLDVYNRLLFNEGKGLLPAKLLGTRKAEENRHFGFTAEESAFKQPPLSGFRSDEERAGLIMPRFREYVRAEAPINGPARRILSFLPTSMDSGPRKLEGTSAPFDPAILEAPRYRGQVVLFTSSFNSDWNNWPLAPTFPPFIQELLRSTLASDSRLTVTPGEALEEYVPITFAGLSTQLNQLANDRETEIETGKVIPQDDAGLVRFENIQTSGIYRTTVGSNRQSILFAVNVPITSVSSGSESDLRRLAIADLQSAVPGDDVQIVPDVQEIDTSRSSASSTASSTTEAVEPRGPAVARILLFILLGLLLVEVFLAWKLGSARAGTMNDPVALPRRSLSILTLLWFIPIVLTVLVLGIVVHAMITGELLGFLPSNYREPLEQWLHVPSAAPGEGTRWRLESLAYLTGENRSDRWLMVGLLLVAGVFVGWIYFRERIPTADSHRSIRSPLWSLLALRFGTIFLLLLVLLPQLKLFFEREGYPDLVILFDDSRSMSTVDNFRVHALKEKATELQKAWETLSQEQTAITQKRLAQVEQKLTSSSHSPAEQANLEEEKVRLQRLLVDLKIPHRLNLIKALLASQSQNWLKTFLEERRMRLHLYRVSGQATRMAELNDADQCQQMLSEILDLVPDGESSQLGSGITTVLKTFRGGSLNGIILFTDGVNTKGEDLSTAARQAARMSVPLYLVGIGDAVEPPDLVLSDLQVEDVVNVNDRLVFEARLKYQGNEKPTSVPVILSEMVNGKPVERKREIVRLDPNGQPSKVKIIHTPTEAGEKTFIIEVPVLKDETETANNRIERVVQVIEARKVRVLLIEGYPRYDFRFLKTLFERENESIKGNKSIELNVFLLSAHPDYPKQDRSAIARFPTSDEMNTYDVVILGDVDPKQLPKREASLQIIADFVKQRGGGLLMIAGEQSLPHAYKDTPLADLLPVTTEGITKPEGVEIQDRPALVEGYRPKLTSAGLNHPVFRFVTEDADNQAIWNKLTPMLWYAQGYRRKLSAEVLAVHPEVPAEVGVGMTLREENHPLVLQQFLGAGRVLFFGFDETWRWRYRQDEVRFNQFWIQAIRSLARNRVGRIELRLDRQTAYRRDEPIKVLVRFPDDAPPPAADTPVRVTVERSALKQPGQPPSNEVEPQTLQLALKEGSRATFETTLTRTPEGEYRFLLTSPTTSATKPKTEARVLPPPGEMDRLQIDEPAMQRAAKESFGRYYPLDEAEKLLQELPEGPRVALDQPCPPLSLWNHWTMFVLFFGTLAAEWILRKRWRLL